MDTNTITTTKNIVFLSSKGEGARMSLNFMNNRTGYTYYFNAKHQFKGLESFLDGIDILVSFGYSFHRLEEACPAYKNKNIISVNIKKAFKEKLGITTNVSRGEMLEKLGYDVRVYEPLYPKAYGSETCKTYQKIFFELGPFFE